MWPLYVYKFIPRKGLKGPHKLYGLYQADACHKKVHFPCIIAENQRFHRADSRIRLQWCQEITVHECAKICQVLKRLKQIEI